MDAKQEMMKNLNETLAFVGQEAKTGMTFLKEQAPLVVQEYLRWELMSSLCLAGFGVLLLLAAYVGYRMFKYAYSQHFRDWTEALGVFLGGGVLGIGGGVVGPIMISTNLYHALYVWTSPRLVVVDYIKHIVN